MVETPARKDPVCGMTVDAASAAGSVEHQGQTYYFCSRHCVEKFRHDPEAFLSAPVSQNQLRERGANPPSHIQPVNRINQKAEPPAHAGASDYTCPMHPEVIRDAPGSCPICGMALEPRTVSLEEAENPELKEMLRRFWVSVALTLPLLVIGMREFIPRLELAAG